MKKIHGVDYDKNQFFWAIMYGRKQIVSMHPRGRDAQMKVNRLNTKWEKEFGEKPWHVKRFKMYFRGSEVDMYNHDWERTEASRILTAIKSLV